MKRKPKGTTIFNIVVILFSVGMLAYFAFSEDGLMNLLSQIKGFNQRWLWAALGFMLLNFLADIFLTQLFVRITYPKYRLRSACRVAMAGQFYNNVTPYGVAGKPMQIVALNRQGIDVGSGSSAMVQKFLVYQTTLSLYSLVMLLCRYSFFRTQISDLMFLTIIAFVFQAGVIVLLLIFSYSKRLTKTILDLFFLLMKKLRLVKRPEQAMKNIEEQLELYHKNCKEIQKHGWLMAASFGLTILQLTCFYVIPYCIYRCFYLDEYTAFDLIAAQAFVTMVASYMPTPGGAGAAEGGFVVMFSVFFQGSVKAAMVLWRVFTYYFTILVAAPFSAVGKKHVSANNAAPGQTPMEEAPEQPLPEGEKL